MQDFTNYNPKAGAASVAAVNAEAVFFQRIYGWMFTALLVTTGVTLALAHSQAWVNLMLTSPLVSLVVGLAPLGLSIFMAVRINHMAPAAVRAVMFLIAALVGGTMAVIYALVANPGYGLNVGTAVFAKAFICTAGTYGAMALYGLFTKRSLQAWGSFLFMGMVGVILTVCVNSFFINSPTLDYVVSIVGILIFAGLTAYHHQALRVMFYSIQNQQAGEAAMNVAVALGAYILYINFLNLFTFFLNLFLSSRE